MEVKRSMRTAMSDLEDKLQEAVRIGEEHKAAGTLSRKDTAAITRIENQMWDLAKQQGVVPIDSSNKDNEIKIPMFVKPAMKEDFLSRTDMSVPAEDVEFFLRMSNNDGEISVDVVTSCFGWQQRTVPLNYVEQRAYASTMEEALNLKPKSKRTKCPEIKPDKRISIEEIGLD